MKIERYAVTIMRESKIEGDVSKYAKSTGWLTYKFSSPNHRGVPDRIYIRNGVTIFIEFKATGANARPLQVATINQMKEHGAKVFIVDSIEKGVEVLNAN